MISEQGPQNGYRIWGNRCASSIGGGVKTKSTESDSNITCHESQDKPSDPGKTPCLFCGKLFKVKGMATHHRFCPQKRNNTSERKHLENGQDPTGHTSRNSDKQFRAMPAMSSHIRQYRKNVGGGENLGLSLEQSVSPDITDTFCLFCGLIFSSKRECDTHSKSCVRSRKVPDGSISPTTSFNASEDNTSCPGIGEKEVASEGFSVSSLDDLIGMATHQQFVMEKGNEPVSIQNCDDVTTPSSMNTDNGKIPTPNVCKVVLQDICKATVKKPGGQVVQGYPCNACQQILTTYRGLEVHRRENPQCSHYTSVCNVCTRSFKNDLGLKQHQTRYKCVQSVQVEQSSDQGLSEGVSSSDCNDQMQTGLESHHNNQSQHDLESERLRLNRMNVKDRVKWPRMSDEKAWKALDCKASEQLVRHGRVEGRISIAEEVILEEAKRLFGCVDRKEVGQKRGCSRRENQIKEVRKQIRHLTKAAHRCEDEDEKGGLLLAREDLLDRRRTLRRAETKRKRRWKRGNIRQKFYSDPYRTCKEILSESVNAPLRASQDTINDYVKKVASDPLKHVDLGPLDGLPDAPLPNVPFNEEKFKFSDFKYILRKTRNASRPGPNQIPYKVYKKCPELAKHLFELLLATFRTNVTPLNWRVSDGIFLPKVQKPVETNINHYRQIALLNVEGKIYWALIAKRLYSYLVEDNNYIKTSSQKGSIKGMAGCWEHTSMVWSALKEAKSTRSRLAMLWLDLANAYGTVPHKLIEFALRRYHVPESWIKLILNYYDGLWGRSSSSGSYSNWSRYEKGIFAGCTISVILFLAAFNVFMEFVELGEIEHLKVKDNLIEVLRGFMDDLSILTTTVPMLNIALDRTNKALQWARMNLKASKSRSLVMQRGKVLDIEPFSVDGVKIPGLQNEPLRTLGRVYDCSINDKSATKDLVNRFISSLIKLDKSKLTAFMKLWGLHNLLQFQIRWDFMIYEIPMSIIEKMERKQNIFVRKWLGVSRSLTDVALYSRETPCPLPFRSLVTLFQTTKVTSHLQLQHSKDTQVKSTCTTQKTGKKWSTEAALNAAQSRLNQCRIVGDVRGAFRSNSESNSVGQRGGLGLVPAPKFPESDGKRDHRQQISKAIQEQRDEELMVKAVNQSVQGAWTRWKHFVQRDLSWRSIIGGKSNLIRFCIGSTFDTLSTPNNLQRWGIIDNPKCSLCNQDGCGILHILTACSVAFGQRRFDYRHNNILRCIANGIQSFLNTNKVISKGIKKVHFIAESGSTKEKKSRKPEFGLLHRASDFQMSVDLNKQLKYPSHIADSLKRPDIVVYSNKLKVVIHIELTSPGEERFDLSYKKKFKEYSKASDLGVLCTNNGWEVYCFPVEVGCRGYVADSLPTCLRKLGLGKLRSRKIVKEAADAALRASFWLWVLRDRKEWDLSTGFAEGSDIALTKSTNKVLDPVKDSGDRKVKDKPRGNRKYPEVMKTIKSMRARVKSNQGATSKSNQGPTTTPSAETTQRTIVQRGTTSVPSGLTNLGNTCYMNSVLQCLFNVLLGSNNFVDSEGQTDIFSKIFNEWKSVPGRTVTPLSFRTTMGALFPKFNNNNHHDAHEWLVTLLNKLGKTRMVAAIIGSISGNFLSEIVCDSCHTPYEQEEPFQTLELPILPSLSQTSLIDLVENFQEREFIPVTRERLCPGCKQVGSAVRSLTINDIGDWLVISIKRFMKVGNQLLKNKRWVSYPLSGLSIHDQIFDLYGLVCHTGTRQEGHYTASIRSGEIWYTCNDAVVQRVSPDEVANFNKEAYLLFYRKIATNDNL